MYLEATLYEHGDKQQSLAHFMSSCPWYTG
jgi:hypothetical protein